jgi:hypothetical protein
MLEAVALADHGLLVHAFDVARLFARFGGSDSSPCCASSDDCASATNGTPTSIGRSSRLGVY